MIVRSIFPVLLKQADIKPIYKKESRDDKGTYKPVSILISFLKFMCIACVHRWTSALTLFFLNTNLDLERDTMIETPCKYKKVKTVPFELVPLI